MMKARFPVRERAGNRVNSRWPAAEAFSLMKSGICRSTCRQNCSECSRKRPLNGWGIKTITVDIRIIAATNQDLETMQKMGTFRKDLYYRLNVLPLHIPPLRNRGQDVIALADYFLEKSGGKLGKRINGFSGDAREAIASYYWPGNVRELENTIEYAVNMESGPLLEKESLPSRITMKSRIHTGKNSLAAKLRDYEQFIIKEALEIHGQTLEGKKRVARELCISLPTLYRKLNTSS